MSSHNHKLSFAGVLIALGIIYGDIGTSPLYVMKSIVTPDGHIENITKDLVFGGISCVFWTLMILTTFKYVYLALNADNKGEGGIFALYALVKRYKSKWIIYPAIIGCAALIADGFLTPPISVSSAVEGLANLKTRWGIDFTHINTVPIVLTILIVLFIIQQFGTNVVGRAFGPIMTLWFLMIATLGAMQIAQNPSVLEALNPYYAYNLIFNFKGELSHLHGFWLLGAVFLCTTGGEALYSDLGHCGKENIRISWIMVFVCLIINYLGQGAYLLSNYAGRPFDGNSVFYALMPDEFLPIGIAIATMSAIIASQALITGCFTLVNEAMKLKLWPNMKVNYPSQMKGQIYIPWINWFLLAGCVLVVVVFKKSSNMEHAYGLAIILNMLMTTSLLLHYFQMKKFNWVFIIITGIVLVVVESAFMVSNIIKFSHGGWFSFLLAIVLFFFIYMWYQAKLLRTKHSTTVPFKDYVPIINALIDDDTLPKEATNLVYLTVSDNHNQIDSNVVHSLFKKHPRRADIYWFVHVDICDEPYRKSYKVHTIEKGKIFFVNLKFGFKVEHKVNKMFAHIVEHMQHNGEVDELSHYPSLRRFNLPADFKFILLHSRASVDDEISPFNQFVIRVYRMLKKLSIPTHEDFGLEIANIENEIIPINIGKKKEFEMERE
jgi:KUP system potassium uptake protein